VRDLAVMPFAGGAERSLASLQDLLDWDWHQDGRSVLVVQQPSVARYDVSELDASTGELRTHETLTGAREWFETVAGGGYVNIRGTRQVELHGLQVRSDTTWTWPATVSTIMNLEPSPDGAHVASMSWDVGDNWILIHRASLADGRVEQVARLGGEGGGAITWMADGSLLVPINESAWSDTWYRIPPRGGTPERLPMQLGQDASFRFTRNGLRGLAREALLRSDVFLLRPPSATMSR
jgi:hypothetical protein